MKELCFTIKQLLIIFGRVKEERKGKKHDGTVPMGKSITITQLYVRGPSEGFGYRMPKPFSHARKWVIFVANIQVRP